MILKSENDLLHFTERIGLQSHIRDRWQCNEFEINI